MKKIYCSDNNFRVGDDKTIIIFRSVCEINNKLKFGMKDVVGMQYLSSAGKITCNVWNFNTRKSAASHTESG